MSIIQLSYRSQDTNCFKIIRLNGIIFSGPSLSRTINGVADEINYNAQIALSDSLTYEQLNAIYTQAVDVALDEFHYSLPGGGGRMYLRRMTDGSITPVTIPRDNIKVKPLGGKSMPVFRITDGDGMTGSE